MARSTPAQNDRGLASSCPPLQHRRRLPEGPQRGQPTGHDGRAENRLSGRVGDRADDDRRAAGQAGQQRRGLHIHRDCTRGRELLVLAGAHEMIDGGDRAGDDPQARTTKLTGKKRGRGTLGRRRTVGDLCGHDNVTGAQLVGQRPADAGHGDRVRCRRRDPLGGRGGSLRPVPGPDDPDLTAIGSGQPAPQRPGLEAQGCADGQFAHRDPPSATASR
jgi:hypothetical protein